MALQNPPLPFPFETETIHHPASQWAELRKQQPVAEIQMPDGTTGWLVTGYEDVRTVASDPRFSRALAARAAAESGQGGALMAASADSIMGKDPPEHTRLRRLVAGAFTARRTDGMRPRIRRLVYELLDRLLAQPQPADLIQNFALPLPMLVLCELLGVPPEDQDLFRSATDVVMGTELRSAEESRASLDKLLDYLNDLIAHKREHPADDLITALIQARDVDDRLSEQELRLLCLAMLIAGYESTAAQIGLFVLTLLHHPDEFARLKAQPTLVPSAVEELLRFVHLGEYGTGFPRVATEDVVLSGVTIPAGATVLPAMIPADRDPAVFADPDRLDLSREVNPHFGFGHGPHRCLGAMLARVELQEALTGLLDRMPGLRLAVPEAELRFVPGRILRTLEELPVAW